MAKLIDPTKLKSVFERLGLKKRFKTLEKLKKSKRRAGSKHAASNNHGVSTPKKRIKMAAESNKINRKRIKHWKN